MSVDLQAVGTAVGSAIVGAGIGGKIAVALLKREVARVDAAIERVDGLETKVQGIELNIAADLMTKGDMAQVISRLDKMDESLDKLKDMVARMEEREKVRHERA